MNINIPAVSITSSSIVVIGVVVVAFILFIVLAKMSRNFLSWAFSGAGVGFFFGIVITLVLGVLFLAKGRGVLGSIANWNATPQVIKNALGSTGLVNVLGAETQKISSKTVESDFDSLSPQDRNIARDYICNP